MFRRRSQKSSLIEAINKKRQNRDENIKNLESKLLDQSGQYDPNIVFLSFQDLQDQLQNDVITPLQCLLAFYTQALKVQKATNCIVEFLLLESFEMAEKLEKDFHKSGKPKPPLYGVPISIKECYKTKNHDSTIGLAQNIDRPFLDDCWIIVKLKELGAIPFVLTNVPQTMMSTGSYNPIFGATLNPRDATRTSGGSSSGEGALLACHGSPLGLGSDIGGSVRIPAHYCGIFALKPSCNRFSQQGRQGCNPGLVAIRSSGGFMSGDIDALVAAYRCLFEDTDFDPFMTPIPFRENIFHSKTALKIGFYDFDGRLKVTPGCKRAVEVAKTHLETKGHQLVPFEVPEFPDFLDVYTSLIFPDNGEHIRKILENDIVDTEESIASESLLNRLLGLKTVKNLSHLKANCTKMLQYKEKFLETMINEKIDCLICPVACMPAPPLDVPFQLKSAAWAYCSLYNLLDFPAGVAPCTVVSDDDDMSLIGYCIDSKDGSLDRIIKNATCNTQGLPVGVQIVSKPYQEEVCLRIMKLLSEIDGDWKKDMRNTLA